MEVRAERARDEQRRARDGRPARSPSRRSSRSSTPGLAARSRRPRASPARSRRRSRARPPSRRNRDPPGADAELDHRLRGRAAPRRRRRRCPRRRCGSTGRRAARCVVVAHVGLRSTPTISPARRGTARGEAAVQRFDFETGDLHQPLLLCARHPPERNEHPRCGSSVDAVVVRRARITCESRRAVSRLPSFRDGEERVMAKLPREPATRPNARRRARTRAASRTRCGSAGAHGRDR